MVSWDDLEKLTKSVNTEREYEALTIGADFAAKVIQARQKRNMTQTELAEKAGLKQSAISRIENQGSLPRIDTVYKIAQALDLDFNFYSKDLNEQPENNLEFQKLIEKIDKMNTTIIELSKAIRILTLQNKHKSVQTHKFYDNLYQKGDKEYENWCQ